VHPSGPFGFCSVPLFSTRFGPLSDPWVSSTGHPAPFPPLLTGQRTYCIESAAVRPRLRGSISSGRHTGMS